MHHAAAGANRRAHGDACHRAPTAEPLATVEAGGLPAAVEYDLGEATIVQERFAEGDRFRNMPVRLNGLIAVPSRRATARSRSS